MNDKPKTKKYSLKSRETSRNYWTDKFFERYKNDLESFVKQTADGAYCDGYNTVLQAYEELFGLDKNYWKLVKYLEENES